MDNKKVTYTIQKKKLTAQEFVDVYKRSEERVEGFAWQNAAVLYATVNHASFKDAFGSQETYADAIGVSKSTISRKVRAVQTRLKLFNEFGDAMLNYSLETVIEMLPLEKHDMLFDFVRQKLQIGDSYETSYNRDLMRDDVKEYIECMTLLNGADYVDTDSVAQAENDVEREDDKVVHGMSEPPKMQIMYSGKTLNVKDEHIQHIIHTLHSLGYEL